MDRRGQQVAPRLVGTLALQRGRPIFFYDPAYLAAPLPLSPVQLPPESRGFQHDDPTFDRLPGLLADALPDGWGRLLQDRAFRRAGWSLETITPLDRLVVVGHAAMGALVFEPAAPLQLPSVAAEPPEFDLGAVSAQAERIHEGSQEDILDALMLTGGSPGGARPKAVIGLKDTAAGPSLIAGVTTELVRGTQLALPDDYAAWLVKFAGLEDRRLFGDDVGLVEAAYAVMAGRAGIAMPPTRVLTDAAGQRHFAVQRFDRFGPGARGWVHMHTAGGLLHASHRLPSLDYEQLFQLTWHLTRSYVHVREMFRRMVFNVLAYNRDDHAKNFAFLMEADGSWHLAPAYDLMYSPGINGWHTTAIAGVGDDPTLSGMRKVGRNASLETAHIEEDLTRVRDAVAAFSTIASDVGCGAATVAQLQARFDEVARRAAK